MIEITARLMRTLLEERAVSTSVAASSTSSTKYADLNEKTAYEGVEVPTCLLPFIKSKEKTAGLQQIIDGAIKAVTVKSKDGSYYLKIKRHDKKMAYYSPAFGSAEAVKEALYMLLCDYMNVEPSTALCLTNEMVMVES